MYRARREIFGDGSNFSHGVNRPFKMHGSTTWLKYLTFHFNPSLPLPLSNFLSDCHNASSILAKYSENPQLYGMAIKLPLPVSKFEAHLIATSDVDNFVRYVQDLKNKMLEISTQDQVERLRCMLLSSNSNFGLPISVFLRMEYFLRDAGWNDLTFNMQN
jgi:hypothetical protein